METLCESRVIKLDGCYPASIVLRYQSGAFHPYVVHTHVQPDDGRPAFHVDGDYHTCLGSAVEAFGERALRELRAKERKEAAAA